MFKYIFFDLDGTLTDSAEGITKCVRYALESRGINVQDLNGLRPFIGPPLIESFMKFYGMTEEEARLCTAKYRERFKDTGIYENKVYPGVPEMLAQLKANGFVLAVATSKPVEFAQRVTDYFDLTQYFDYITGPDFNGSLPTKADVIADALRHFSISEAEKPQVLMVGDRSQDITGAKKCGLKTIGVRYGYAAPGELEEAGADYILETPQDIVKLVCGR